MEDKGVRSLDPNSKFHCRLFFLMCLCASYKFCGLEHTRGMYLNLWGVPNLQ